MKCYECKKVKNCKMHLERDENEKTVGVYYCAPCVRAIAKDKAETDKAVNPSPEV